MNENVSLVKKTYEAIGRGDIPSVVAMMTDDVVIHCPGPSEIPFSGTYLGPEGVIDYFQTLGATVAIQEFEPREFIAQDDQVVVLGHEAITATATGKSWETDWAMVWTVRGDRISRLREFHQTGAITQAFG
jgi:uncharacterized protein